MKQKIQLLLHTTGVFSYYYGYQYFIRSVELAVQNPERLQSIQKEIYITVASEFQTSITSVERDIRTIRDVMMKNGGEQLLVQMTGCPAWAEFMLLTTKKPSECRQVKICIRRAFPGTIYFIF